MLPLGPCALPLLLAVTGVEAGSRAWQPPLVHAKAAIAVRDLSGVNNVYSNGTNVSSSHHAHQKRYYGINTPAESELYPRLWPGGNIYACFEQVDHVHEGATKSTRAILYDQLITARELWRAEGLDDKNGNFQFIILDDDDARCEPNQRSTTLLIIYAGEGVLSMSTTVGIDRPRAAPGPGVPLKKLGPSMTLSDSREMGMGNVVANYAHEMGHAWGLHHEHQNPKWWDWTFSRTNRDKYFFSEENFKCENLADFDKAMERVAHLEPLDRLKYRNDICRSRTEAMAVDFAGGLNYLPVDSQGTIDGGKDQPDWDSIMLYPSNTGGKIVDGVKQKVLFKIGGADITPNFKPSKNDVKGLRAMYGIKGPSWSGKLLNDVGSSLKGTFDSIRKKDKDSKC